MQRAFFIVAAAAFIVRRKTTMKLRFLGVGQICRHNNVKKWPNKIMFALNRKMAKIRFLFVDHKYHTTTCTLSYFSFFSIFVLQVSYCLNISRGQMFWWWGRRDIWKRVGIFNLFFFGGKKNSRFICCWVAPTKRSKNGQFSQNRISTNHGTTKH